MKEYGIIWEIIKSGKMFKLSINEKQNCADIEIGKGINTVRYAVNLNENDNRESIIRAVEAAIIEGLKETGAFEIM